MPLALVRALIIFTTLFVGFHLFSAQYASAQEEMFSARYLNPTTYDDCKDPKLLSFSPLERTKKEASACLRSPQANSRYVWVCRDGSQGYPWPYGCSSLENRRCDLVSKLQKEREICNARVAEYRKQDADRRKAEEETAKAGEEAARRQAESRIAAEMAKEAGIAGDWVKATGLANKIGRRGAKLMGLGTAPALELSNQLTKLSFKELTRMQTLADGELMKALGGGAFDIEGQGDRGTSASSLPGGTAGLRIDSESTGAPDIAPYGTISHEAQEMIASWDQLSPVSQTVGVLTLIAQMIMVMQNDGNVHPSLVDGSFAANIVAITEAAATGEIFLKRGEPVDGYAFAQDQTISKLVEEDERRLEAQRLAVEAAEAQRLADEKAWRVKEEMLREEQERIAAKATTVAKDQAELTGGPVGETSPSQSYTSYNNPPEVIVELSISESHRYKHDMKSCGCFKFIIADPASYGNDLTDHRGHPAAYKFSMMNSCEHNVFVSWAFFFDNGDHYSAGWNYAPASSALRMNSVPVFYPIDRVKLFYCINTDLHPI